MGHFDQNCNGIINVICLLHLPIELYVIFHTKKYMRRLGLMTEIPSST